MERRHAMSNREIDRLRMIRDVLEKKVTWSTAAEQLGLCIRQIGNLCKRVRMEGNRGVIHHLIGKRSNHQLTEGLLERSLRFIQDRYRDFGPTFANEKLLKHHGIQISTPTLRKGMTQGKLWRPRKQKAKHRAWRERRSQVGMMIQVDGSEHDWLEGRGEECVLIIYIDDATSRIMYGEFVKSEDTVHLMGATKKYLEMYGRPSIYYVDKDSIYVVNRQATIEEELRDNTPLTQFSRAMKELGIKVVTAHSPQAKGRVERGFRTHQDRLVKELRLANISTIESANRFLRNMYIPAHNARFAHAPAQSSDAHRPLLATHDLAAILSLRTDRVVHNDWTIRYKNSFFQLLTDQPVRIRPKFRVKVEIRLDESIHVRYKNQYLKYKKLPARPYRPYYANKVLRGVYKPPPGTLEYAKRIQVAL